MKVGEFGIFSETTFPDETVQVEKAEIDLFGDPFKGEKIKADLFFLGGLKCFNLPMIKYSWLNSDQTDALELPNPHYFSKTGQLSSF